MIEENNRDKKIEILEKTIKVSKSDYQSSVFQSRDGIFDLKITIFTVMTVLLFAVMLMSFSPGTSSSDKAQITDMITTEIAGVSLGLVVQTYLFLAVIMVPIHYILQFKAHYSSTIEIKDGIVRLQGKKETLWSVSLLDISSVHHYVSSRTASCLTIGDIHNRHFTILMGHYVDTEKLWVMLAKPASFFQENDIILSNDYTPVDNRRKFCPCVANKLGNTFDFVGRLIFPKSRVIVLGKDKAKEARTASRRRLAGGIITVSLYLVVSSAFFYLVSANDLRTALHLGPSEKQLAALAEIPAVDDIQYAYFCGNVDDASAMPALEFSDAKFFGAVNFIQYDGYNSLYYEAPIRVSSVDDIALLVDTHKGMITNFVDKWDKVKEPQKYYDKVFIMYQLKNGKTIKKVINKGFRKEDQLPLFNTRSNLAYIKTVFDRFIERLGHENIRVYLKYGYEDQASKYHRYDDYLEIANIKAFANALKDNVVRPNPANPYTYDKGKAAFIFVGKKSMYAAWEKEVSFLFNADFEPYIRQILKDKAL